MANRLLDLKSNFFCLIERNDVFSTSHFQALVDLGLLLVFFVGLLG